MKKVLIATTALVMTAGVAAAESHLGVKVSGTARMGVVYDGTDTVFSSRVRIIFTASGETDGGLSFGAEVRNDQSGVGNTANGDSTVYIKGAFGKLTMGDVSGGPDALVGQTSGLGYGPNDGLHEIGFIGTTKTAAYYEYSTGALTIGVGAGQTNTALTDNVAGVGGNTADELNIAVKYVTGDYSFALGYETADTDGNLAAGITADSIDQVSASASAKFGGATVKAKVADDSRVADLAWSLSVDFAVSGANLTAVYTDFGTGNDTFAGIGATYDLGGGATLAGMIGQDENAGVSDTVADVGVKFSF
jgi:outer membrane protein OmpU